jgi:hypothetical protein
LFVPVWSWALLSAHHQLTSPAGTLVHPGWACKQFTASSRMAGMHPRNHHEVRVQHEYRQGIIKSAFMPNPIFADELGSTELPTMNQARVLLVKLRDFPSLFARDQAFLVSF